MSPAWRPFVLLDRDGTLVRDTGYVHRIAEYALLPGVVEGLRRLQRAGFSLAIVTNQSGIGRGRFGTADFEAFQAHLVADLARQGISIEATLHCPHVPEDHCPCRKPAPGLLLRARDELGADLARSWVVGDAARDVEAARRAGCAGAVQLVTPDDAGIAPGARAARDLVEAAALITTAARATGRPGACGSAE